MCDFKDINTASNSLWQKAGVKGSCGANKFRKAAVSATRDREETDERNHKDLANLMAHTKQQLIEWRKKSRLHKGLGSFFSKL